MPFKKEKEEVKEKTVAPEVPQSKEARFKLLETLGKTLDKKHSTSNSLRRLGNKVGQLLPSIHTNLPSLDDYVFGCGGVPRGAVIEIFGPESAGKTTVALDIIASAQRAGGIGAFVDAEHALDPTYARVLGVDVENLLVNQPMNGEQALDVTLELIRSKCVEVIVVDSVAALVPEAELAGEIGDAHVGLQARMMSQTMRMLIGEARRNMVTVIFINQIREKIGVMYGNPEVTPGGRALKFYSTIRLDVRRREPILDVDKKTMLGHHLELKAVKNKVGTPFRSTTLDLYYPGTRMAPGLDRLGDLVSYAAQKGLFIINGSWYSMDLGRKVDDKPVGVENLGQGLDNVRSFFLNLGGMQEILRKKLAEIHKQEIEGPVKDSL